jgi:hypothetical protein
MYRRFTAVLVAMAFTLTGGGAVVASAATPVSEMSDSRTLGHWEFQGAYYYGPLCVDIGEQGVEDGSWNYYICDHHVGADGSSWWHLFVYIE